MIPDRIHDLESGATWLLTEAFRGGPNNEALLRALLTGYDLFEEEVWKVVESRNLDNALGVALDGLGSALGEARLGRSDDDYRAALRVVILARKSQGTPEDLLGIVAASIVDWTYLEEYPACVRLEVFGPTALAIFKYLLQAKPAGVRLGFVHSTHAKEEVLHFQDVASLTPDTPGNVLGSTTDPLLGLPMASLIS